MRTKTITGWVVVDGTEAIAPFHSGSMHPCFTGFFHRKHQAMAEAVVRQLDKNTVQKVSITVTVNK